MKKLKLIVLMFLLFNNNTIISAETLTGFSLCTFSKNEKKEITYLNCSNLNMHSLEGIKNFQSLETLILSNNNIENISELDRLYKLKVLDLSNNQIDTWTNELDNLNIKELYLTNNSLKKIPSTLTTLNKLEILDLSGNDIEDIPNEFGNLSKLTKVNLSLNNLSKIPEVNKLNELTDLNLENNTILKLPNLSEVPLRNLYTEGNLISGEIVTKYKTFNIKKDLFLDIKEDNLVLDITNSWENKNKDLMNVTKLSDGKRLSKFDDFELIDEFNNKINLQNFIDENNNIIKEGSINAKIRAVIDSTYTTETTTKKNIEINFIINNDLESSTRVDKTKEEILNSNSEKTTNIPSLIDGLNRLTPKELPLDNNLLISEEDSEVIQIPLIYSKENLPVIGILVFTILFVPFIGLFLIILKTKKLVSSIEETFKKGESK